MQVLNKMLKIPATSAHQIAQSETLIVHLFITFLLFQCATGLGGRVLVNSPSNQKIEGIQMDPLTPTASQLGSPVTHSITLSSRGAKPSEKNVSDVDENGKYIGTYFNECSKIFLMPPPRICKMVLSTEFLEKGQIMCHWKIIGTRNCLPNVTCINFNLFGADPNTTIKDPCPNDYLEVTDGSYGYQKFCGTNGPVNLTPGRNARDIYLTLKLSFKAKNRLFGCIARCITVDTDDVNIKTLQDNIAPLTNPHCKCGRQRSVEVLTRNSTRHDDDVRRGEIPWIVALVVPGTRNPLCVGTIINDRFILTAAHCIRGKFGNASSMEVLIHPHELNVSRVIKHVLGEDAHVFPFEQLKMMDDSDRSFRHRISRYIVHPLRVKQTNDFDVALLKLSRPIDFKERKVAVPICLPDTSSWDLHNEGESVLVSGWNIRPMFYDPHDDINIMKTLKKKQVEVFRRAECDEIYNWRFSDQMLCAGQRTTNVPSLGDIGSPLMMEKSKGVWEQIGILTYGQGVISRRGPGIYVSLRRRAVDKAHEQYGESCLVRGYQWPLEWPVWFLN